MFYDQFEKFCAMHQVSLSKAASEIGLSNSTVTKWKKTGATPQTATLNKIAEYFNVSITELLNEDIKKDLGKTEVSDMDSLFLNGMHQLSPEDQLAVLAYIHSLRNK